MEANINSVKQKLWNLVSSGLYKSENIEIHRKAILCNLMIILGSVALVVLASLAFIQKYFLLGLMDLFFLSFLVCLFFYFRKTKKVQFVSIIGSLSTGIFFALLVATGSGNNTGVIWILTFPLIAIFLLSLKKGMALVAMLLICVLAVFYMGHHVDYLPVYKIDLVFRIIPCYITSFLFAYVEEKVRQTVQRRLEQTNADLESTNLENKKLIQKIKQTMKEVEYLSTIDPLTGLYNRRHFEAEARKEIQRAQRYKFPFTIVMMDIDHFKKINDSYGHVCGDEVLSQIAAVCNNKMRSTDLLGRYGGEEFSFLLPVTGLNGACALINRLRKALADLSFKKNGRSFSVTASFGVYEHNGDEDTLEEFLERSDQALYKAKNNGRNCIVAWSPKSKSLRKNAPNTDQWDANIA